MPSNRRKICGYQAANSFSLQDCSAATDVYNFSPSQPPSTSARPNRWNYEKCCTSLAGGTFSSRPSGYGYSEPGGPETPYITPCPGGDNCYKSSICGFILAGLGCWIFTTVVYLLSLKIYTTERQDMVPGLRIIGFRGELHSHRVIEVFYYYWNYKPSCSVQSQAFALNGRGFKIKFIFHNNKWL